jgi:hypothetical protein
MSGHDRGDDRRAGSGSFHLMSMSSHGGPDGYEGGSKPIR